MCASVCVYEKQSVFPHTKRFLTLNSQAVILLRCQLNRKTFDQEEAVWSLHRFPFLFRGDLFLSCLVLSIEIAYGKTDLVNKIFFFWAFFSPLVVCRAGGTSIFSSKTRHVLCFLGMHTSFFNEDCLLLLYETLTIRSSLLVISINALLKLPCSLVLPSLLFATGGRG